MKNILILCTGNSARSILAETLLNALGNGRVRAYSAGSKPKGEVHPASLRLLQSLGHDISGLHSKSWDEFGLPGAPRMDMVITVCDSAASESCPVWPGAPVRAHWGIPDPAAVGGAGEANAFRIAHDRLKARVVALLELPFETMSPRELSNELNRIGAAGDGATKRARRGTQN